jgi:mono/diheme cytochrome c family protein/uncharacterized cupredoxin-like copper-binding protein
MSDERSGRELTPAPEDGELRPREGTASVERFDAGERAHRVELTEERAAEVVKQSGSARRLAFLVTLIVVFFIPIYWIYEQGISLPFLTVQSGLAREADQQYITSVSNGYKLFLANCAQCHGPSGQGGVGPPLNDQAKLYNALTATGLPGSGHLNPNYLANVLTVGGRYVCGDASSVMPIWSQANGGPLNYQQIQDLINFITASKDTSWTYQAPKAADAATAPPPVQVQGWTDPSYTPPAGQPTPPACWRNPSGQIGGGGGSASSSPGTVANPGTAANPRVIKLDETAQLQITDDAGKQITVIPVKAGETVTFEVTNTAGFDHNFYIGAQDALQAGSVAGLQGIPTFSSGTMKLTWLVPQSGAGLQYGCVIPGHYTTMHGEFDVIP